MNKPRKITVEGYEMLEKIVGKSGTSGYAYLPTKWIGKKIVIIALDPLDDE
jgi:putative transposon-encoded protein